MFTLNQHAVPLKDKDGNERKTPTGGRLLGLGVTVKAEPAGENTIRMVASTEDVDRAGDIIRAEGWQLGSYNKNPVVLWGHDHHTPAVMEAKKTWIEDKKLLQDWYSDPAYRKEHPIANLVWAGYQPGGPLRASSVGFMPLVYENREPPEDAPPDTFYGLEFKKQELYEVSAVNVPANPEALQMLQAKGLDTRPLEEMWQHMEDFVIEVKSDEPVEEVESDGPAGSGVGSEDEETPSGLTFTGLDEPAEEVGTEGEGPVLICTGTEEETTGLMVEELEARGYRVVAPDDIFLDDEPDIFELAEDEPLIELEPEPSEITEAHLDVVRQTIQDHFAKEKEMDRIKRAVRREFNKKFGILED